MATQVGALIIDIAGTILTPEDQELLNHPSVGGIILFARNYASKQQVTQLCAEVRRVVKRPLLILVDQEGGRVQRFRDEFTQIPAMGTLGQQYEQAPQEALAAAYRIGHLLATELLAVGVDLSLAPVLDLNFNQTVIGDRAFHSDPDIIIKLATSLVRGMQAKGMAAVGKHFPGHGTVQTDSHQEHPIDYRPLSEIENQDAVPFRALIREGIQALLPAHILCPEVDDKVISFSHKWLKDILRTRYGFKGTIISDDLSMQAAKVYACPADRTQAAREAGCDFVLFCNDRSSVVSVLDSVDPKLMRVNSEYWQPLAAKIL